jgi:hypothetical protein
MIKSTKEKAVDKIIELLFVLGGVSVFFTVCSVGYAIVVFLDKMAGGQ